MPDSEEQNNKDKKLINDNETREEQEELKTILDQISEQPAEKVESPSRPSDEQVIKGPRGSKDDVENVEELLQKITETPGSQEKPVQKLSFLRRLRRFFGL